MDQKWPPPNIPSDERVHRDMDEDLSERDEPPRHIEDVSEIAFRIRRWAHFRLGMPFFTAGNGETLTTFATLDPSLYTPTREKPYQGIWVGDYSAHGCEFLLFLQRDTTNASTASAETENTEWIPHGRLEAIKLTGDPNVPRGEMSFAAEDIGQGGFVRVANDSLFRNARVVRSDGHVAGLGFRDGKPEYSVTTDNGELWLTHTDTWLPSQLILQSTDCVAHYWESMGHISYFRRVDIDALLQT